MAGVTGPPVDRRAFLASAAAVALAAGCRGVVPSVPEPRPAPGGRHRDGGPDERTISRWIETIFERGVRRPGYAADTFAERFAAARLAAFGLARVRLEPVTVTRWTPRRWSLDVHTAGGATHRLDSFPLPYGAPVRHLECDLVAFDPANPTVVAGQASLYDAPPVRLPPTALVGAGSAPDDVSGARLRSGRLVRRRDPGPAAHLAA